jgi:hypothetical protein
MCTLLTGAILAPGERTISSALRAVGLDRVSDFSNYHEVLNRAQWSPMVMSRILLGLIVTAFVPADGALRIVGDDTLERRRGRKVIYKSIFRDAVRSTVAHVTLSYGIRWVCLCALVDVPWSSRPWALPFMLVPALSEKRCEQLGKGYRSPSQWAIGMLARVRRWYPDRRITFLADGGYASGETVYHCQRMHIRFISRLRLDAALYAEPVAPPKGRRGPKPKKGARQPSFTEQLSDPQLRFEDADIRWYGGQKQRIQYATGRALWPTSGHDPVRIRWVLLRPPEDVSADFRPAALLCSDTDVEQEQIVEGFLLRWNIEVTFEEMRSCLGLETQRHWSVKAVGRTTPCLFGLFSLVVLIAKRLYPSKLPIASTAWYDKQEATFRDVIAAVRMHLWKSPNYVDSPPQQECCLIPTALLNTITKVLCYAS